MTVLLFYLEQNDEINPTATASILPENKIKIKMGFKRCYSILEKRSEFIT